MLKFLALTTASVFLATTGLAQDVPTLDLTKACESGCVIQIKFDDSARIGDGGKFSGMFKIGTGNKVMSYFVGMTVNDTGMILYELESEPGKPLFRTMEDIQTYIKGVDALIGMNQPAG